MRNQKELLEELYLENKLSTREIAGQFGIHNMTVLDWLRRFNIPARTISEANAGQNNPSGDRHPRWNGGKKRYFHVYARKIWETYWKEKVPNGYVVHHVDKNYKNNDTSNLALLTLSYHKKIHMKGTQREFYWGKNENKYS